MLAKLASDSCKIIKSGASIYLSELGKASKRLCPEFRDSSKAAILEELQALKTKLTSLESEIDKLKSQK
jgi:hypothetical protein